MAQAHSLHALDAALRGDLQRCNTEAERINCRAIGGREIRETAASLAAARPLTDGERAIAQRYGFN